MEWNGREPSPFCRAQSRFLPPRAITAGVPPKLPPPRAAEAGREPRSPGAGMRRGRRRHGRRSRETVDPRSRPVGSRARELPTAQRRAPRQIRAPPPETGMLAAPPPPPFLLASELRSCGYSWLLACLGPALLFLGSACLLLPPLAACLFWLWPLPPLDLFLGF